MFIDAHTHKRSVADVSVLNFYPGEALPEVGNGNKLSCGIHPWYIKADELESDLATIESYCQLKFIHAIGECGLDKYTDNIGLQTEVFIRQVMLSERYKLPLIIHSVKTHHLVQNLRKTVRSNQPWIIHGFNGSIEMAKLFVKQNIFISFGQNLLIHPEKAKKVLDHIDKEFVLLETDDSNIGIKMVYEQVSLLLNISVEELEKQIELNFNRVFC